MSRWIEFDSCSILCNKYVNGECLGCREKNGEGIDIIEPSGFFRYRKIDKIEPDGFPKWCPGIDLEKLKAKYRNALQYMCEGECPLEIIADYYCQNHKFCSDKSGEETLLCWDKYFEEEASK